jgi:2-polyprenyl-6-hydroxyphenyl methylase/3-demethylubiquinone-9 3-methyltransferase
MKSASLPKVNNDIYHDLGERWYNAQDDPVALLRAESRLRNPWIAEELRARFAGRALRILDVGCGGGFLSNYLAAQGHAVVGLDFAADALKVARLHDISGRAAYLEADAHRLPFPDGSFDAVCSMDFLEHVEQPECAIREASRLLSPGGVFIFHTFSRNWLAWLVVIKGVEWFVRNTPPQMHVLRLFIKPEDLVSMCVRSGLAVDSLRGIAPAVFTAEFWKLLMRHTVSDGFAFRFTRSTRISYSGIARKSQPRLPGRRTSRGASGSLTSVTFT